MMVGEPSLESAPITRERALLRAKYLIDKRYGDPQSRGERNESRDLAGEMMTHALAAALYNGDRADELEEKLVYCLRLVQGLEFVGRSTAIDNIFHKRETERTEPEKVTLSLHRAFVWRRYDVANSFTVGLKSGSYFDGNKDAMTHMAAEYLSKPWARHGMVDWIFLDMMITRETCMYGEQLKMSGLPRVPGDYVKHNGNLSKMRGDVGAWVTVAIIKCVLLAMEWGIPLASIRFAFRFGYVTTGWVFVALFALSTIWWLLRLTLRFGTRIYWHATGKTDPAKIPLAVNMAMFDVWRLLEGPVVNPKMVKEAMQKAKEKGAVWDGAAWSIIDRAIAIDPAVMVATASIYREPAGGCAPSQSLYGHKISHEGVARVLRAHMDEYFKTRERWPGAPGGRP